MTVITIDLVEASNEELMTAADLVTGELDRRGRIEQAEAQIDEIVRGVLAAEGVEPGDPWVQPTGAHDAYPVGWTVEHDGAVWESLTAGNVWEPGVSGWRTVGEDWPAWVQPTGAHDSYQAGDQVTFEGARYRSRIDGNTWSPSAYPAGWQLVTD